MNIKIAGGLAALVASVSLQGARAELVNLVQNGDFSQTTYAHSNQFGSGSGSNSSGSVTNSGGQGVTGWLGGAAYQVLFVGAGTATTCSANTQFDNGYCTSKGTSDFWGTGYTTPPAIGPFVGGANANIVALDGTSMAGVHGAISQTFNNLVVGDTYQVTFEWAAGQFQSHNGNTKDYLQVTLGGQTASTLQVSVLAQTFTPWQQQTFNYTATSATETLSFTDIGTPANGLPPVAALYGVSMTDIPEPGSLAIMGGGLALLGLIARRRRAAGGAA